MPRSTAGEARASTERTSEALPLAPLTRMSATPIRATASSINVHTLSPSDDPDLQAHRHHRRFGVDRNEHSHRPPELDL